MTKIKKPTTEPKKYIHRLSTMSTNFAFVGEEGKNVYLTHNTRPGYVDHGMVTFEEDLPALGFIEAPTEEVKGDWIDSLYHELDRRQGIKMSPIFFKQLSKQYMPKPVEQELIPLDVEKIKEEVKKEIAGFSPKTFDGILLHVCLSRERALSKYGVQQEEKQCNICNRFDPNNPEGSWCGCQFATPTPQATSVHVCGYNCEVCRATSVIDVENDEYRSIYSREYDNPFLEDGVTQKETKLLGKFTVIQQLEEDSYSEKFIGINKYDGKKYLVEGFEVSGRCNPGKGGMRYTITIIEE